MIKWIKNLFTKQRRWTAEEIDEIKSDGKRMFDEMGDNPFAGYNPPATTEPPEPPPAPPPMDSSTAKSRELFAGFIYELAATEFERESNLKESEHANDERDS